MLNVYKDKPRGYWPLAGNLFDYSGYSLTAIASSPITDFGLSMVAEGQASSIITAANDVKFPHRIFTVGREKDSFTLEAWVFPQSNDFDILSHPGDHDGLSVVAGAVRFTVPFTGPWVTLEYLPETKKAMHVVGAYTKWGVSLYINGDLVASQGLTEDQRNSTFAVTNDGYLHAGYGNHMLKAVAIYEYALSPSQVASHYRAARATAEPRQVARMYGGTLMPIYEPNADTFMQELIGPELSWDLGYMQNLTVQKGRLVQQSVDGVLPEGTWTYAFNVGFAAGAINGVTLAWQGEGQVTVETSLDNATWTAVSNNTKTATIAPGTDVTNKILYIRITFPEDSGSWLEYLDITGFRTNGVKPNTRPIVISPNATIREYADFMEHRTDSGLALNGYSVTFGPAANDYEGAKTLEVLYYSDTASLALTISTGASAVGIYRNGVAASGLVAGRWEIFHIAYDGDIGTLALGGNCIIGHVATYPDTLTAQQVADIVAQYTGRIKSSRAGTGTIGISTPETKIYSNDWSIDSSG